jgi:hypothetical protein
MTSTSAREFLRRHVLGLMAIFIALSGTAVASQQSSDGPKASASVVTNAKFKKLKKRVAAAEAKLNAPVTGDLTGTLPNLQIRPNAVTTAELADNAVNSAKIANDAVGSTEIANDAVGSTEIANDAVGTSEIAALSVGLGDEIATATVGADELKNPFMRQGTGSQLLAAGATTTGVGATGSCFATEEMLGGYHEWSPTSAAVDDLSLLFMGPSFSVDNQTEVGATNGSSVQRTLFANAFCMPE